MPDGPDERPGPRSEFERQLTEFSSGHLYVYGGYAREQRRARPRPAVTRAKYVAFALVLGYLASAGYAIATGHWRVLIVATAVSALGTVIFFFVAALVDRDPP